MTLFFFQFSQIDSDNIDYIYRKYVDLGTLNKSRFLTPPARWWSSFSGKIFRVLHRERDWRFNIILRDAINVAIYSLKINNLILTHYIDLH